MGKRAEKVGRGKCPCCAEPTMFRKSQGGMLTYSCDECDSSGYAEPGGKAFAKWSATITKSEPEPAPGPTPPPAAPAPPTKKTGFSLDQL